MVACRVSGVAVHVKPLSFLDEKIAGWEAFINTHAADLAYFRIVASSTVSK